MTEPNKIKVVIYGAKSSPDKEGSLDRQVRRCEKRITEQGGREIVGWFSDENKSAWSGNRGEGLAEAWALAEQLAKQAQVDVLRLGAQHSDREIRIPELWLYHTSRIARGRGMKQTDARHLDDYMGDAVAAGFKLRSVTNDKAFSSRSAAAAQGDIDLGEGDSRSEFTRDGLADRVELHKLPPGGRLAYGYKLITKAVHQAEMMIKLGRPLLDEEQQQVRGRIEIEPAAAAIVQRIFGEYIGLRSPREIARDLQREGVPSPGKSTIPGRTAEWREGRISDILRHRFYLGEVEHLGKVYPGSHEAIISPELFAAAQARRLDRCDPGGHPTIDVFLLKALLWCGECERRMTPHSGHGNYQHSAHDRDQTGCTRRIKRQDVDPHVIDYFQVVGFDREAALEAMKSAASHDLASARKRLAHAERARLELIADRATNKANAKAGRLAPESWEEFRADFDAAAAALDAQIALFRSQVDLADDAAAVHVVEEEVVARIAAIRKAAAEGIGYGQDVEAVRRAIRRLFAKFVLFDQDSPKAPSTFAADLWMVESRRFLEAVVQPSMMVGFPGYANDRLVGQILLVSGDDFDRIGFTRRRTPIVQRTGVEFSPAESDNVVRTAEEDLAQPPSSRL